MILYPYEHPKYGETTMPAPDHHEQMEALRAMQDATKDPEMVAHLERDTVLAGELLVEQARRELEESREGLRVALDMQERAQSQPIREMNDAIRGLESITGAKIETTHGVPQFFVDRTGLIAHCASCGDPLDINAMGTTDAPGRLFCDNDCLTLFVATLRREGEGYGIPRLYGGTGTETRPGDWNCTRSGKQFWPLDPQPEDVDINDIAFALSNVCRYAGHVPFYSVAQHSVHCADLLLAHYRDQYRREDYRFEDLEPEELKNCLTALLHDAGEAYVGDMTRPLKRCEPMGPMFCEIEDNIYRVIADTYGAHRLLPAIVKWADDTLLVTEVRDLHPALLRSPWRRPDVEPLEEKIERWSPEYAYEMFLGRFYALTGMRPIGLDEGYDA